MNDRPTPPDAFISAAALALLADIDALVEAIAQEIERAEPEYSMLITPERLRANNREHALAILSHLSGSPDPGTAVARANGRRAVELHIPLTVVLRAYRIGTSVMWSRAMATTGDDAAGLRGLLRAGSKVWELVDEYSQALTLGYQEALNEQQRRDTRVRDAALDALLSGRVDGARLREAADIVRLPYLGQFVVVSAASESAAVEPLPGIGEALAILGVRSAWGARMDSHIGIVAVTDTFTVDRLVDSLNARTTGLVGVSRIYDQLADTPIALRQAELACAAARPGARPVIRYDHALIPVLLAGEPEITAALADQILGRLLELPEPDRATLIDTMSAWFESDGEVAAVAAALFCHRNTVRFRLNRITELTGRRFSAPGESAELYLALQAYRIRPAR